MIPNLPTDNLYKFLALAGLALGGFGFWASWSIDDSIRFDEEVARGEAVNLAGDFEANLNRIASTSKGNREISIRIAWSLPQPDENGAVDVGTLDRPVPGSRFAINVAGKRRESYRGWLKYIDEFLLSGLPHHAIAASEQQPMWSGQVELFEGLRTRLREHSLTVENLWHKTDSQKPLSSLAFFGGVLGVVLSVTGFTLWYYFVQRPLDDIARSGVDNAKSTGREPYLG